MPAKEKQPPRPLRVALERARDFIESHYGRPISLEELAAVAGLSRFHLVRAFARAYGRPPHAYQVHLQVEKGRALLCQGVLPAIAAAEVGFSDQSHFSRHFKKTHGVTPRRYIKRAKRRP